MSSIVGRMGDGYTSKPPRNKLASRCTRLYAIAMAVECRSAVRTVTRVDRRERRTLQPIQPLLDLLGGYRPRRVIEIGGGSGELAIPLAIQLPETTVIAVDHDQAAIETVADRVASLGLSNVRVASTDPSQLPFRDQSTDAALMVNLFHGLKNRRASLREARRVLSPGGRFVICDWDPERFAKAGPPRHRCVAPSTAKRELIAAGFGSVAQYSLYEDFWVVTARRP